MHGAARGGDGRRDINVSRNLEGLLLFLKYKAMVLLWSLSVDVTIKTFFLLLVFPTSVTQWINITQPPVFTARLFQ